MNRQAKPICIQDVTGLADDLCPAANNLTQPIAATSNVGVLSNEAPSTQPLHLHSYTVPSGSEAFKRSEDTRFQAAQTACQPAEFDIIVDAVPVGKLAHFPMGI